MPVIHNLDKSNYKVRHNDYTYIFSSEFYKQKFEEQLKEKLEDLIYKFYSRFNINIDIEDYFVFYIYSRVEKRGFKVIKKTQNGDEVIRCLDEVTLNGALETDNKPKD